MKRRGDIDIAKRAAAVLLEREAQTGVSTRQQLEGMGMSRQALYQWGHASQLPGGDALSRMAHAGYDVMYVLTGRRTK